MGGAVIDIVNNCGYLAGEQIIFSSYDECINFISMYGPTLVAADDFYDKGRRVIKEYEFYPIGGARIEELHFNSFNPSEDLGYITF